MITLTHRGFSWGGEGELIICKSTFIEDIIVTLIDRARDTYGSVCFGCGDYVIELVGNDETLVIDAGYEFKTGLLDSDEKLTKYVKDWYKEVKNKTKGDIQ